MTCSVSFTDPTKQCPPFLYWHFFLFAFPGKPARRGYTTSSHFMLDQIWSVQNAFFFYQHTFFLFLLFSVNKFFIFIFLCMLYAFIVYKYTIAYSSCKVVDCSSQVTEYIHLLLKSLGSERFFFLKKPILLFSNLLNWSNVTVKNFRLFQYISVLNRNFKKINKI